MDRAIPDLAVHKKVLDAGVYLEFDTIGRFKYHSDEQEIALFQTLLDQGYEDQLLFSLDTTRERLKAYNPDGVGLDYILKTFCPAMRNAGITSDGVQQPGKIGISWAMANSITSRFVPGDTRKDAPASRAFCA